MTKLRDPCVCVLWIEWVRSLCCFFSRAVRYCVLFFFSDGVSLSSFTVCDALSSHSSPFLTCVLSLCSSCVPVVCVSALGACEVLCVHFLVWGCSVTLSLVLSSWLCAFGDVFFFFYRACVPVLIAAFLHVTLWSLDFGGCLACL